MRLNRNLRAFSLIELMVVIAIVALLASVAVPSYKDYIFRTFLHTGLPILSNGSSFLKETYDTSELGTTIVFGGLTINSGNTFTTYNVGPFNQLTYYAPLNNGMTADESMICMYYDVSGNGYSDYDVYGTDNSRRICHKITTNSESGSVTTECVVYTGTSLIMDWMPNNCGQFSAP